MEQRAAEWKQTLREEPKVARLLLRRLIGPLELYDESTRPDFIEADTVLQTGLIEGLAEIQQVASPSIPSWNQIAGFLDSMRRLRDSSGFAA